MRAASMPPSLAFDHRARLDASDTTEQHPSPVVSGHARPRVLFAVPQEPLNHLSFSGAFRHMVHALRDAGFDVDMPGHALPFGVRLKRMLPLGRFHAPITRTPEEIADAVTAACAHPQSRITGRSLPHRASRGRDVVFAPLASELVPLLPPDVGVVYFSDATPRLLEGGYASADRSTPEQFQHWDAVERAALARADRVIYASRWAAASAVRDYGVSPNIVTVAPFGSPFAPKRADDVLHPLSSPVRLLWMGTDWDRKGGARALDALEVLRASGMDVELHMCGARGPGVERPGVFHHGFLERRRRSHRKRTEELFRQAHVFLLPTRADCSPLVLAEAAAWGVPVVTTRVGGVPEIVQDGRTGLVVENDASAEQLAHAVRALVSSAATYARHVQCARAAWAARLTWQHWAECVGRVIHDVGVGEPRAHRARRALPHTGVERPARDG